MKIMIALLFAFGAMSGVVKAGEIGTGPASSLQPAERAAADGAGSRGEVSPDALGEAAEPVQACWCATYCQSKGAGCYAECDYESGDCGCVGKCR